MQLHVKQECIICIIQTVHTRRQGNSNTILVKSWTPEMILFVSSSWEGQYTNTHASCTVSKRFHACGCSVSPAHEWLRQPLVCGVVCFWRLIRVQPKLKLTCFLHALWSSVNVSWVANPCVTFKFQPQGSCRDQVIDWRLLLLFCFF